MMQWGTAGRASCGGRQLHPRTAGPTCATLRTAPGPSGPLSWCLSEVGAGTDAGVPGQPRSSATPFPFPEAPVIQGDSSIYQVERSGDDALLDCHAQGHPEPLIRWSKDGVPVMARGRLRQLQNGSLAIRAVGVSRAWGGAGTFWGAFLAKQSAVLMLLVLLEH